MFAFNSHSTFNNLSQSGDKRIEERSLCLPKEAKEVRGLTQVKKNYIQTKTVAIYMCQTPTVLEQEDLSTCLGVKGPRDQHSGRMNEVLCLTPGDSS